MKHGHIAIYHTDQAIFLWLKYLYYSKLRVNIIGIPFPTLREKTSKNVDGQANTCFTRKSTCNHTSAPSSPECTSMQASSTLPQRPRACGRDKGKDTASDGRASRPDQTSAATYGLNHEPSARARVHVPTCPTSFTLGSLICRRGQARGHDCPSPSHLHPPPPSPFSLFPPSCASAEDARPRSCLPYFGVCIRQENLYHLCATRYTWTLTWIT